MKMNGITRRLFLTAALAAPLASRATAQTDPDMIVEDQRGDPGLPAEQVVFSESLMARLASNQRAILAAKITDFPARFLAVAQEFVGFNRQANEAEISEMLGTFGLGFRHGQPPQFTAYCAAGASFTAALLYARQENEDLSNDKVAGVRKYLPEVTKYHFQPSVSVIDIWKVGDGTRRMISRDRVSEVLPGWLVVFDWNATGDYGRADHIGIVESYNATTNTLNTVEFNTSTTGATGTGQRNGGYVARRERSVDGRIKGFIDTGKAYLT